MGEAPGQEESEKGRPFVGPSGMELRRMLRTLGVALDDLFVTNAFSRRPPGNDLGPAYGVPRGAPGACIDLGPLTTNPTFYMHEEHLGELERLHGELTECSPNIVIALGNTACWALGLGNGINSLRGALHPVRLSTGRELKVLPTYHPAAVLREWPLRVVTMADLQKALLESDSPELTFDNTELWLEPSLNDLHEFASRYMEHSNILATDVETRQGQITCLSFAPDGEHSLVIPFWREGPHPHYWRTPGEEASAWRFVKRWIEDAGVTKVTQNGLFDIQYFRAHGMNPRGFREDTMLAHHSLFPEQRKGLGFLGSLYANYPNWKSMRTFKREEFKRDE